MLIDKITAATRLIQAAIKSHVRGDDPLQVHLSVYSAVTVTIDLRRKAGLGDAVIEEGFPRNSIKDLRNELFSINNYLKHADRDPDAQIDIGNIGMLNELGLVLASVQLKTLGVDDKKEFWIMWFMADYAFRNPGVFSPKAAPEWVSSTTDEWQSLRRDFVVKIARNPDRYRDEIAKRMPGIAV